MKRPLIIAFLFLLLLCGCQKSSESAIVNGISFKADISVGNKYYTVNGEMNKSGIFKGTVQKPEILKGLQIYADKDKASFEFMGLVYENQLSKYPINNIANIIVSSMGEGLNAKSGTIKGYDYEIEYTENGLPKKLSVPELNIQIDFKNVQKTE